MILYEEIVKSVSVWLKNQKTICEKNDVEFDLRQDDESGIFIIFDTSGDYAAQLIVSNDPYSYHRYILFEILKVSTANMIYSWMDNDDQSIENIINHLDVSMSTFLKYTHYN